MKQWIKELGRKKKETKRYETTMSKSNLYLIQTPEFSNLNQIECQKG